jgi:hypothetical protein
MNGMLKAGTLCFLIAQVDYPALAGRVVEVLGEVQTPSDETGQWYQITAEWAQEVFPDRPLLAPRKCLLPICPPGDEPPGVAQFLRLVPERR